jgi:hypothetical protein
LQARNLGSSFTASGLRPGVLAPPTACGGRVNFTELLDIIGYREGEYLSISHQPVGGSFTPHRVVPYDPDTIMAAVIETAGGCQWFGVNPVNAALAISRADAAAAAISRAWPPCGAT